MAGSRFEAPGLDPIFVTFGSDDSPVSEALMLKWCRVSFWVCDQRRASVCPMSRCLTSGVEACVACRLCVSCRVSARNVECRVVARHVV